MDGAQVWMEDVSDDEGRRQAVRPSYSLIAVIEKLWSNVLHKTFSS